MKSMPKKSSKGFSYFHPKSSDLELRDLKSKPASFWERKGDRMALSLFNYVRDNVPAYKRFLTEHRAPFQISTPAEFKKLPITSKKNYLRTNPYETLFPTSDFSSATTISATSGSTGEPFYFPRTSAHDAQYEHMAEIFLKNQFSIDSKKTLGIIGFGLGIWIGGIFTYKNFNKISEKGYGLTLVPVGANKDLYLKTFKKFAPYYDQVILMGYPPFVKDVLDTGKSYGIEWKKHNLKILTAAEGYSENFRKYIARKAGIKNFLNDIINMYGTVEQGTLAHETSFGNLIRKIASEDERVFKALFPRATNIPTLAQYYPHTIYFEEVDGAVVASGYGSSIPLVRYTFADLGGVIPFDEIVRKLRGCGVDIFAEANKHGIDKNILRLPFVYVYTRSDFSVVFRGANIYPEEVRAALDCPRLSNVVTGKTTIIRKEDKKFNQILEIHVELASGVKKTSRLKKKVLREIVEHLCKNNSEFKNEYFSDPAKSTPVLFIHKYNTSTFFPVAGKQPWVLSLNPFRIKLRAKRA